MFTFVPTCIHHTMQVRVLRMLRVLHAKSVVQQLEELLGRYVSRMIFFSGLVGLIMSS